MITWLISLIALACSTVISPFLSASRASKSPSRRWLMFLDIVDSPVQNGPCADQVRDLFGVAMEGVAPHVLGEADAFEAIGGDLFFDCRGHAGQETHDMLERHGAVDGLPHQPGDWHPA